MALRSLITLGLGPSPGFPALRDVITLGLGPSTTGLPTNPPGTPTLTIVDNGDGTGATATVTGSSVGSANVVGAYTAMNAFVAAETHTGDNSSLLSLPVGSYYGYDTSTLNNQSVVSNVIWFSVTDGSIYQQFAGILAAIQSQLITYAVLPASQIFLVVKDDPPAFQADHEILIRPLGFLPVEGPVAAAGRRDYRVRRRIRIYIRTRLALDESDRETAWLTEPNLGHTNLEERVLDALCIAFFPVDAMDKELLAEPMRVLVDAEYRKWTNSKKAPGWGDQAIDFEASYDLRLNQAIQ